MVKILIPSVLTHAQIVRRADIRERVAATFLGKGGRALSFLYWPVPWCPANARRVTMKHA